MTRFEVFSWFVLPVIIAGAGWAAALLHERAARKSNLHPGE